MAAACWFCTAGARADNIVLDGDFEGSVPGSEFWTFCAPEHFGPWVIPETGAVESGIDVIKTTWPAASGSQSIDLDGRGRGTIYQDIPTEPGRQYRLSFALAGNPDTSEEYPQKTRELEVFWSPRDITHLTFDTTGHEAFDPSFTYKYTDVGWTNHSSTVTAAGSITRLSFRSLTEGPFGVALDKVVVEPLDTYLPAFVLQDHPCTTEGFLLRWVAASNQQFQVYCSAGLLPTWQPLVGNVIAESPCLYRYLDTNKLETARFYRVLQLP